MFLGSVLNIFKKNTLLIYISRQFWPNVFESQEEIAASGKTASCVPCSVCFHRKKWLCRYLSHQELAGDQQTFRPIPCWLLQSSNQKTYIPSGDTWHTLLRPKAIHMKVMSITTALLPLGLPRLPPRTVSNQTGWTRLPTIDKYSRTQYLYPLWI